MSILGRVRLCHSCNAFEFEGIFGRTQEDNPSLARLHPCNALGIDHMTSSKVYKNDYKSY